MRVDIARSESGTKVNAKGVSRHARILGVITRCQPDGYALTLFETVLDKDVVRGYCHIPAFWLDDRTAADLEAAAGRWVLEGVIATACLRQPME